MEQEPKNMETPAQDTNLDTGNTPKTNEPAAGGQSSKTYTQADLDARESSAKKSATDKAQKALFESLGVKNFEEFNAKLDIYKAADKTAADNASFSDKYDKLNKENGEKDTEIADWKSKNAYLERIIALQNRDIKGSEAEMMALGLANRITDEKDFEAVITEYLEENPRSQGQAQRPNTAGAGMGAGAPPSNITVEQFHNMTIHEQSKLATNSPELYNQLMSSRPKMFAGLKR